MAPIFPNTGTPPNKGERVFLPIGNVELLEDNPYRLLGPCLILIQPDCLGQRERSFEQFEYVRWKKRHQQVTFILFKEYKRISESNGWRIL
jgi:hypothetical protein